MLSFHMGPGMWTELWLFWLIVPVGVALLIARLTTKSALRHAATSVNCS